MDIEVIPVPYDSNIPVVKSIGSCFKNSKGRYFQQQKNIVLHVNRGNCINNLYVNHLSIDPDPTLEECSIEEFSEAVRFTIYELEIDNFWKF